MGKIKLNKTIYIACMLILGSCTEPEDTSTGNSSNQEAQNIPSIASTTLSTKPIVNAQSDSQFSSSSSLSPSIPTSSQSSSSQLAEGSYEEIVEEIYNPPTHIEEPSEEVPLNEEASIPGSDLTDLTVFATNFELETQECWNNRPNSGGWNFAGCGGLINIGKGSSVKLAENEISHSGNKSLKITFNIDEDYGGAEVSFPDSEHIYSRYYDYYDNNFDFGFAMKTHRIRSFNPAIGRNDFDSVMVSWGQPISNSYFDMSGVNEMQHLSFNFNGGPVEWGATGNNFNFQRNRWYCIESEIKLNTPNQSNGEVRIWIDGTLHTELTGINIRGGLSSKINLILFGGWYSNSAAGNNPERDPAQSSIRYIDDIAVSTEKIGCSAR